MNWIAWHEYSQPVLVWAWTSQKVSGHSSSESERFLQGLRRAKMAMLQPRKDAAWHKERFAAAPLQVGC
jgi:hypothetical protein